MYGLIHSNDMSLLTKLNVVKMDSFVWLLELVAIQMSPWVCSVVRSE